MIASVGITVVEHGSCPECDQPLVMVMDDVIRVVDAGTRDEHHKVCPVRLAREDAQAANFAAAWNRTIEKTRGRYDG